jgi:hypothetical protein
MKAEDVLEFLSSMPVGYELKVTRNAPEDFDILLGKRTAAVAVSTVSKSPKATKPDGYDNALKSLRSYSNASVIGWAGGLPTADKLTGDERIDAMHGRARLAFAIASGTWSIPAPTGGTPAASA